MYRVVQHWGRRKNTIIVFVQIKNMYFHTLFQYTYDAKYSTISLTGK